MEVCQPVGHSVNDQGSALLGPLRNCRIGLQNCTPKGQGNKFICLPPVFWVEGL